MRHEPWRPILLAVVLAVLACVGGGTLVAQDQGGTMPNECCPEPHIATLHEVWRPELEGDVAATAAGVTTYGSATRTLKMPDVPTGMQGMALLYHGTLQFDMSATAWINPTGQTLMGSDIAVPSMSAVDLDEGVNGVQPRPGTWPGLYLFEDDGPEGTGAIYQYGSPVTSGANPQSTATYPAPPPGAAPTQVRQNQLSGAQLWYYLGASPAYIEIKHVDGTVARFESFNPYIQSFPYAGRLWRLDKVTDPYDNVADYTYAGTRLSSISFPSGRTQSFNYNPSWSGWTWSNSPSGLAGFEVTYSQTSGTTTTQLPGQSWGIVFDGALATSGGRHFGSRVSRIYSSVRRVQKEQLTSGQPYAASSVSGQVVSEFTFDTGTASLTETQRVHTGSAFDATLSTIADLPDRSVQATMFDSVSKKVTSEQDLVNGVTLAITYGAALRGNADVLPSDFNDLLGTTVTDSLGNQQRFEYANTSGRLYSIVTTPVNNADGRPRAHSGVTTSDVEPDQIEVYRIFGTGCTCQKPIESRVISTRGGSIYTRTTKYEYDSITKLLTKRTVPNPATTPLPQPAEVDYVFSYVQAKSAAQAWGAWLPDQEVTPDGTYTYYYNDWLDRADATNHGRIAGTIERRITNVRIQDTLSGPGVANSTVSEFLFRNLSNNPGSLAYQGNIKGQPRRVIDSDGVSATFDYTTEGWLLNELEYGGSVQRSYAFDSAGNVTAINDQVSATSNLRRIWNFPAQSAFGSVYEANSTSGGLLRAAEYYYDRYGNLAISRRNNLDSAGQAPQKHNGSGAPRSWVESQWQYKGQRLVAAFEDRKPLDEASGGSQFAKMGYSYRSNGQLLVVDHPSGAYTTYSYDGYDTLFTATAKDPTGNLTATTPSRFVTPFLEVASTFQLTTATEALWTTLTRNAAGAITQIVEPSTDAAQIPGYTGSTGGAVHRFEIDQMGRVIEARGYAENGSTLLTKREIRYDQLDRSIWQHDFVLGFGSGDQYAAWRYQANKGSWLQTVERTGVAASTYAYGPSDGFLKSITDGFGTGNKVDYSYYSGTPFVSAVTRTDLEPGSGTRVTQTAYDVDPFGHVLAIRDGTPQLVYAYAYNSLGRVDRYTDPMGRVQKFLGDGHGRIVEHVRVGIGSDYIRNRTEFDDFGTGYTDGRTRVLRFDHLDNVTVTHSDFAGRPFIVQNPGGDDEPTLSAKNKSMCLYAEFDGASRLSAVYDGSGGKTTYKRDGPGRLIWRELAVTGPDITLWNSRDILKRDAIGRLTEADMWGGGPTTHGSKVLSEYFSQDSVGRTHEERYDFFWAPANELAVQSSYTGGNPFRQGLDYLDNLSGGLSAPLSMHYAHDAIGRLSAIDWTGNGSMGALADYDWIGGLRRNRTVKYSASSYPEGHTFFDYDSYGRLIKIDDHVDRIDPNTQQVVTDHPSQFDYEYDDASNLIKEKYTKVGGWAGDRFAYDAYHRLTEAWMGVSQSLMTPSTNPVGFVTGQMVSYLAYGLDGVNNRTTTDETTSGGTSTIDYTLQDGTHPQGPSNRYNKVGPAAMPEIFKYDSRGNLTYDGRFYYKYDYLNRLQEVWKVATDTPPVDGDMFAVSSSTSLADAEATTKNSISDFMRRLPREHKDPAFRSQLRAYIVGGVMRFHANGQSTGGGGGMFAPPNLENATLDLVAVYAYDAFNRRVGAVVVGDDTQFHTWDGWRQVVQYRLDTIGGTFKAAPTKEFVWGAQLDELLSYRRNNAGTWESYFVFHGGQDTATKLVSQAGAVVEAYEYDPYGGASVYVGGSTTAVAVSSVGLPFLWKSTRLDSETGLLLMRNRYYAPALGRFLTRDPLGVWADYICMGNGQCYVGDNPLVNGDPLGLQSNLTPGFQGPPSLRELQEHEAEQRNKPELPEAPNKGTGDVFHPGEQHEGGDLADAVGEFAVFELLGHIIGGVAANVLGGFGGLGTADRPLPTYWEECAYCGSRCPPGCLCHTPECIERRMTKSVRDEIRRRYPGFFGRHPSGLGGAKIEIHYDPGGFDGRDDKTGLPTYHGPEISIDVSVPDLGIEEHLEKGGDSYLVAPNGQLIPRGK